MSGKSLFHFLFGNTFRGNGFYRMRNQVLFTISEKISLFNRNTTFSIEQVQTRLFQKAYSSVTRTSFNLKSVLPDCKF